MGTAHNCNEMLPGRKEADQSHGTGTTSRLGLAWLSADQHPQTQKVLFLRPVLIASPNPSPNLMLFPFSFGFCVYVYSVMYYCCWLVFE